MNIHTQFLIAEFDQVWQRCFIGIPIAPSIVLELRNSYLRLAKCVQYARKA
jgi:hypothetical protein